MKINSSYDKNSLEPKKKIIIVDNDEHITELVPEILYNAFDKHDMELDITTYNNAEDALSHLQSETADLVITDGNLPGISGPELMAEVNRLIPNVHTKIRFIIMSGDIEQFDMETLHELHPNLEGSFAKPFNLDEFINRIESVLIEESN